MTAVGCWLPCVKMRDAESMLGSMDDTLSSCIDDANYTTWLEIIGVFPVIVGTSTPVTVSPFTIICHDSDKENPIPQFEHFGGSLAPGGSSSSLPIRASQCQYNWEKAKTLHGYVLFASEIHFNLRCLHKANGLGKEDIKVVLLIS